MKLDTSFRLTFPNNIDQTEKDYYIAITTVGLCIYITALTVLVINAYKFWHHRTSALILFYSTAFTALLSRILYLVMQYTDNNGIFVASLFILPGTLTLGIGISQVNIYIQLILRVSSIQKSMLLSDTNEATTLANREKISQYTSCILIFLYPCLLFTELILADANTPISNH